MALISGFLKQRCEWTARATADDPVDAYGKPVAKLPAVIKCRWVLNAGWQFAGQMGASPAYSCEVMVVAPVREGDTLAYKDNGRPVGGVVKSVKTIIDTAGKEQGRICYV